MKKWLGCELLYLSALYPTTDINVLAAALGRNKGSVKSRVEAMKLRKDEGFRKYRVWTEVDKERMRQEYPKGDLKALAEELGVTMTTLWGRGKDMGLKRDPDMVLQKNRELGRQLSQNEASQAGRFKKGSVSPNKGKKVEEFMTPEQLAKFRATQFNSGLVPHNRVPVGSERHRPDGFTEVKVRDGHGNDNWEFKHRRVYEENTGPIPEGYMVEFIDGNRQNFAPDNLRAVSRQENAARNIEKFHALPSDLKDTIRLLGKLKKQLK